jgi:hypothetical protein
MQEVSLEHIKQAVHDALDERDGMDRETHRSHHEYIRLYIERDREKERRRKDLNDKVRATLIGGLLLMIVGSAITGMYRIGSFVIDQYEKSQDINGGKHQ